MEDISSSPIFIKVGEMQCIQAGETLSFDVMARQPAFEASSLETSGKIYNESVAVRDFTVQGIARPMVLKVSNLPDGANFDPTFFSPGKACAFTWRPAAGDISEEPYIVTFTADDGILPIQMKVKIKVL